MLKPPDAQTLARLRAAVGPTGFVTDEAELAPHLTEWRSRYHGTTPVLLRPDTTAEVAAIVRVCAEERVGLVPQGGNTGLVGGQIPRPEGNDVLVSLSRLDRIRAVDPVDNTLTAEAGCILASVQAAATAVDRLFPLSLAAEGSAQIGGLLSANAGGIHVLRYGNARRLVLGLEVVTAEGQIWNGLRALRKDNTGYDLKHLYIAGEGTLGIITAAVLEIFPRHRRVETLLAAVPSVSAAVQLLSFVRSATEDAVLAFELISAFSMEIVQRNVTGAHCPLSGPTPWYVLADLTTTRDRAEAVLADALEEGLLTDAVLAEGPEKAAALWRLRESISEAQKPEGGSIKHDVSVPVSRIPELVERAVATAERIVPGIRPCPFGHVGDGNLHFNFSQPVGMDKETFLGRWEELNGAVHDIVADLGGSVSAEHGIGRAKREEARRYKSPVEIDLMRRVKEALDPLGIMNPGKGVA